MESALYIVNGFIGFVLSRIISNTVLVFNIQRQLL